MPSKTVKSNWVYPVNRNARISQVFGGSHKAIDIAVPVGTPLYAPTGGKVSAAGVDTSGYGVKIMLHTPSGQDIILGHLSEIDVKPGQTVKPGQFIGRTGNTGNSTGPHLHYEIRQGSGRVDPLSLYYEVVNSIAQKAAPSKPAAIIAVTQKTSTPVKPSAVKTVISKAVSNFKTAAGAVSVVAGGTSRQQTAEGAASQGSDVLGLKGILSSINWKNIGVGVIGLLLVAIGVFGIMQTEIIKSATNQLAGGVSKALSSTKEAA